MKRKKWVLVILAVMLFLAAIPLAINLVVCISTQDQILAQEEIADYPVAVVLGAKAHENRLSDMLRDRMDVGIALYQSGAVRALLLTGDDTATPSETDAMLAYALTAGVPREAIFIDGSGFCTFDSIRRAKEEFGMTKFVIVTQKYHLYRALYIANRLDCEAIGADAALYHYRGQLYRDVREILARCKDFLLCL